MIQLYRMHAVEGLVDSIQRKSDHSASAPVPRTAELCCVQHVRREFGESTASLGSEKLAGSKVIFKRVRAKTQRWWAKVLPTRSAQNLASSPCTTESVVRTSERLPPEQKVVGSNPTGRTNHRMESITCTWRSTTASRQNHCFGPPFDEFWQPIGNHAAIRANAQTRNG